MNAMREELQAELELLQEAAKKHYDERQSHSPEFKMGDCIMVLCCNIQSNQPSTKLDYRRLGPFKVLGQVGKNAFRLQLPTSFLRLHPVFNVNLLERYTDPSEFGTCFNIAHPAIDPQLILAGENPLKIKKILNVHKVGH